MTTLIICAIVYALSIPLSFLIVLKWHLQEFDARIWDLCVIFIASITPILNTFIVITYVNWWFQYCEVLKKFFDTVVFERKK